MNLWTGLMEPLRFRPGDAQPPQVRKIREPQPERTPAQMKKREQATRRPNAHLPPVDNPWGLTAVQCAVVERLAAGKENPDIAKELNISKRTVEAHVQNAKDRMGDVTRAFAAVLWDRFTREQK